MRTLGKIVSRGAAALLGAGLGVILFSSLMIVDVTGSSMLPELEPGDRVLVLRSSLVYGEPELQVGDLVIYEAPYYTTSGEGRQQVRRVTGMRGSWLRLNCDMKTTVSQEVMAVREEIQGKVIGKIPRLEIF